MPSCGDRRSAVRTRVMDTDSDNMTTCPPTKTLPDDLSLSGGELAGVWEGGSSEVRRFLSGLNRSAPTTPEGQPVPTDSGRRTLLLRRLFQRQYTNQRNGSAAGPPPPACQHKDSPWPSPAHRRRQINAVDADTACHSETMEGDDGLSSASSLTNVSTISSSYVGDELALGGMDSDDDEQPYPDQDWLHMPINNNRYTAAELFMTPVSLRHSTVTATPGSASLLSDWCGPSLRRQSGTLTDEYDQVPCLEHIKQYTNNCSTCGVDWTHQETSLACNECGGYPLQRPCITCAGVCGSLWNRDLSESHERALACWTGSCVLSTQHRIDNVALTS